MLPSGETIARSLLPGKLERAILGEKEDEKSTAMKRIQTKIDNDAALQALLKELADKDFEEKTRGWYTYIWKKI